MTTVYVPGDASAVAVGADEVAAAFGTLPDVTVVRNGSRGMLWLEPLVEVDSSEGRVGYANVLPHEAGAVLDGSWAAGDDRALGVVEEHPWLATPAPRHGGPRRRRRPRLDRRLRVARRLGRPAPGAHHDAADVVARR